MSLYISWYAFIYWTRNRDLFCPSTQHWQECLTSYTRWSWSWWIYCCSSVWRTRSGWICSWFGRHVRSRRTRAFCWHLMVPRTVEAAYFSSSAGKEIIRFCYDKCKKLLNRIRLWLELSKYNKRLPVRCMHHFNSDSIIKQYGQYAHFGYWTWKSKLSK